MFSEWVDNLFCIMLLLFYFETTDRIALLKKPFCTYCALWFCLLTMHNSTHIMIGGRFMLRPLSRPIFMKMDEKEKKRRKTKTASAVSIFFLIFSSKLIAWYPAIITYYCCCCCFLSILLRFFLRLNIMIK